MSKGGLPSIGGNKGVFEVDSAYLAKAQAELNRLADFDVPQIVLEKDTRSMHEILKAKREKTEAVIEESKSVPAG